MRKNVTIICNGKYPRRMRKVQALADLLAPHAHVTIRVSTAARHAEVLAREASADGAGYIIGAGGDGTINEVVNGMMQFASATSADAKTLARLGVLPLGTGNDFARQENLAVTTKQLFESVVRDNHRRIDVGRVEITSEPSKTNHRYFINIADVGMSGEISAALAQPDPEHGNRRFHYQRAIFKGFRRYSPRGFRVVTDDFERTISPISIAVANGTTFGGGIKVAPMANAQDGLFEIVMAEHINLWTYLKYLPYLILGHPIADRRVQYRSGNTVQIMTEDGEPAPLDVDGDAVWGTAFRITCIPKALWILTN